MEELKEPVGISVPSTVFDDRRKEEWKSNKIDKLAAALSKAQSEIRGAVASSVNPFFKSNYADLDTVIKSCFPQLTKNGLSIIQGNDTCDKGSFYVTTMLLHESGQWIKSKLKMPITKKDAQGVGATCTYARRFALSAMVGIAQTDDDGNSISTKVINKGVTNG
tara:strand:+ start:6365 stop:6856 length:492 start_codon:yes stop_codon:yes gene_type:complete